MSLFRPLKLNKEQWILLPDTDTSKLPNRTLRLKGGREVTGRVGSANWGLGLGEILLRMKTLRFY